jgi:hypothetical protein
MNVNRMLTGAAIIGCLTAAMTSGVYAQEGGTRLGALSSARANGEVARHAAAGERRVGTSPMRQGRGYAAQGAMRDEPRMAVGTDGRRQGNRMGYRDGYGAPSVYAFGPTGGGYAYPPRRLYAYAPTYAPGYVAEPGYGYSPPYDGYENADPYDAPYTPGFGAPYGTYGAGVGIGVGPIGIGIGPGWHW